MCTSAKMLRCAVQKYAWGNKSSESLVAELAESGGHISVEEDQNYAEFWMGTHPNGSSQIKKTGEKLKDFLDKNINYFGSLSLQHFGDNLPFLFKVLSVAKPLSIQIHPNQQQARELNEMNPEIYREANHKPEMCVAISPFFALCGFRPYSQIVDYLNQIPELSTLMGKNPSNNFISNPSEETLKICFTNLMDRVANSKDIVESLQNSILDRNANKSNDKSLWNVFDWFSWVASHFNADVGCFCVFLLNIVKLDPDEAIFLDAGIPHAYLFGECMECMACSDMVIRAGLTSKLCDVPNLCRLVNYSFVEMSEISVCPRDSFYVPPQKEFGIEKILIERGHVGTIKCLPTISICLVLTGSAKMENLDEGDSVAKGSVFVLPADCEVKLHTKDDCCSIFRAFVNLF